MPIEQKPQKTRLGESMYPCWTVTISSTPCHEDHVGSLVSGGDQVSPSQYIISLWEESGRRKATSYREEAASFLKRRHGQCHKPSLSVQCQQRTETLTDLVIMESPSLSGINGDQNRVGSQQNPQELNNIIPEMFNFNNNKKTLILM